MSNYPPGVTGSEYYIAGPDNEEEVPCPSCGEDGNAVRVTYRGDRWIYCDVCDQEFDDPFPEPDPDRARDEREDR